MKNNKGLKTIKDLLYKRDFSKPKYIKHEWQEFGYRMAVELNDLKHRALYMRFAKTEDRNILQKALDFTKDYVGRTTGERGRAKLFMWKLKDLRNSKNV